MKLTVLEKKQGKLKIEVDGEDHTLLNILRENAWKAGAKQSLYTIKHPYLSKPEITIKSDNPKKVLADSAKMIIDDSKIVENAFKASAK